jgi:hypothetical protein
MVYAASGPRSAARDQMLYATLGKVFQTSGFLFGVLRTNCNSDG